MASLRSWLYRLARVMGDVDAVKRGEITDHLADHATRYGTANIRPYAPGI